uniref:Uncharacterized protein n=1 Tax=Rhodnius prolixus TaxID=13249 RepID=T1I2Y2_RHOPR
MLDKGDDFVKNESSRVENVIKGKISKEILAEIILHPVSSKVQR